MNFKFKNIKCKQKQSNKFNKQKNKNQIKKIIRLKKLKDNYKN